MIVTAISQNIPADMDSDMDAKMVIVGANAALGNIIGATHGMIIGKRARPTGIARISRPTENHAAAHAPPEKPQRFSGRSKCCSLIGQMGKAHLG